MTETIKEIPELVEERAGWTDEAVLAELAASEPLADEDDPRWMNEEAYWKTANLYLALARIASARKLRPAIMLLLERASYGDPNSIMRGLRHHLEEIVNPDWTYLADVCLEAAKSSRLGTRLWAIDELSVIRDPRARPIFEEAVRNGPEPLRWKAEGGLERLADT